MTDDELKQEIKELERQIRAKEKEQDALGVSTREKLRSEFEELIRYSRKRGHTWLDLPFLFLGPVRSDAERVETLVEMAAASAVAAFKAEHIEPLKKKLREKREDLKKPQEWRTFEKRLRSKRKTRR